MLNAKSSENFLSPDQNWANFGGFGGLGVRGYKKFRFLLQKAQVFVNPRRLSHFVSKSVEGCDLQVVVGPDRYMTISELRAYHFGTSIQTTSVHITSATNHAGPDLADGVQL